MKELSLPNLQTIGTNFMMYNYNLTDISIPNIISIDTGFLMFNNIIDKDNIYKEMGERNNEIDNQRSR